MCVQRGFESINSHSKGRREEIVKGGGRKEEGGREEGREEEIERK